MRERGRPLAAMQALLNRRNKKPLVQVPFFRLLSTRTIECSMPSFTSLLFFATATSIHPACFWRWLQVQQSRRSDSMLIPCLACNDTIMLSKHGGMVRLMPVSMPEFALMTKSAQNNDRNTSVPPKTKRYTLDWCWLSQNKSQSQLNMSAGAWFNSQSLALTMRFRNGFPGVMTSKTMKQNMQ